MVHTETHLFTLPKDIILTHMRVRGNSALIYSRDSSNGHSIFWNGYRVECSPDANVSLSLGGTHLAVANESWRDKPESRICLYSLGTGGPILEKIYPCDLDVIYHLEWISDTELAWEGWYKISGSKRDLDRHIYINGQSAPEGFTFEPFFGGSVGVRYPSYHYTISPTGERSLNVPCDPTDQGDLFGFPRSKSARNAPLVTAKLQPDDSAVEVITFKGKDSPQLRDSITGGMIGLRVNKAETAVIFTVNKAGLGDLPNKLIGNLVDKVSSPNKGCGGFLYNLLAWPIVILCNPYFGPLYALSKAVEYQQVMVWDIETNTFSTLGKCQQLLGVSFTDNDVPLLHSLLGHAKETLTIGKVPGPTYQKISGISVNKQGQVTYVGVRKEGVYRVVVS